MFKIFEDPKSNKYYICTRNNKVVAIEYQDKVEFLFTTTDSSLTTTEFFELRSLVGI